MAASMWNTNESLVEKINNIVLEGQVRKKSTERKIPSI